MVGKGQPGRPRAGDTLIGVVIDVLMVKSGQPASVVVRYLADVSGRSPHTVRNWISGYPIPRNTWLVLKSVLLEDHGDCLTELLTDNEVVL